MTTLQRLNRERGLTVVLVTHDSEVAQYADRVVTVRDGLIVSDQLQHPYHEPGALEGTPSEEPPVADAARGQSAASQRLGLMALRAAGQALARNKLRSALTMLGIFIGVAALIAMVAVGQGANQAVQQQIASLGTNLLIVMPGR